MPLVKNSSKKAVGKNIQRETAAGKPRAQAIAIALNTQRKAKGMSNSQIASEMSSAAWRARQKAR